jgi:hypothetical protein
MIAASGGKSIEENLAVLQKQFENRELEVRSQYAAKVEMIRSECGTMQKKLEDEVNKRENEMAKLVNSVANTKVRDSNPVSPRLDANDPDSQSSSAHNEFSEKVKSQISNAVAEYAKKMESKYKKHQEEQKRGLDASWEDQIHHISKEMKVEDQQRAAYHARDMEELTAQISVLRAEDELLKSGTVHAIVDDDTEIRRGDAIESALGTNGGFRTVKLSVSCRKGLPDITKR